MRLWGKFISGSASWARTASLCPSITWESPEISARYSSFPDDFLQPLIPVHRLITIAALLTGVAQLVFLYNLIHSRFWGKPARITRGKPLRSSGALGRRRPGTILGVSFRSFTTIHTNTACGARSVTTSCRLRRSKFRRSTKRSNQLEVTSEEYRHLRRAFSSLWQLRYMNLQESIRNECGVEGMRVTVGETWFQPTVTCMRRWTTRRHRPSTAIWVVLFAITMMFAAFSSALFVRKGSSPDWRTFTLPSILYFNTVVLLVSSVALEISRRRVATFMGGQKSQVESPARWLYITLFLGLLFVAGQYAAWLRLRTEGLYLATNPSSSFFYVLTATHALHVFGGLGGLVHVIRKLGSLALRRSTLDATARYWHSWVVFGCTCFSCCG